MRFSSAIIEGLSLRIFYDLVMLSVRKIVVSICMARHFFAYSKTKRCTFWVTTTFSSMPHIEKTP